MNPLRSRLYSSLLILLLTGGGFIWLAVNSFGFATNDLVIQLVVVLGMLTGLIVTALLAGIGLRALLQRLNDRHREE